MKNQLEKKTRKQKKKEKETKHVVLASALISGDVGGGSLEVKKKPQEEDREVFVMSWNDRSHYSELHECQGRFPAAGLVLVSSPIDSGSN